MTDKPNPTQYITDDLDVLLAVLPPSIERAIRQRGHAENLLEIILDLGRPPTARYTDGEVVLDSEELPLTMIEHVITRIGEFDADNRAGMPRTLHRISAIRNRRGHIVGLTCRVGRAVYGTVDIIQDIISSGKSVLMMGPPGIGKCITGDSLVLTHHGLETLAGLIPDDLGDDQFAPAATSVYGRDGLEPASHVYNGGLSETLRITTRQGFSLEGTPEHPVLALTETGELAFRRLDELEPGDHLAIQRGQQVFGTHTELPVFECRPRTNALDPEVPWVLDEDLARFLGYLVAEGTLSFDNQVYFSNTDPEVQADMAQLTERLFGLTMRRHLYHGEWNGKDFRIFGVKLRRFLLQLGLSQGRAADKRIPPCILTAPKPAVTAFLRALFEGDGSVCGPQARVEIASASRRLMAELHVLLLNYGIVGNLRAKHNTTYDRDYYALTLLGENVARFQAEIGFLSSTKRAKLEQSVAAGAALITARGQAGGRPAPAGAPAAQQAATVILSRSRAQLARRRRRISDTQPSICRYGMPEILRLAPQTALRSAQDDRSALWADQETAHYFFDPVTRIEAGENYVYDLTVPGTHSFFANGFVSHNTTMLREAARVLAENKRVIVVDTSNEIGGDGDIAHPAVGRARRMQVATPSLQHEVMIEAVENHNPQVIIIDEIGRELEAQAARTIAERGVQLIGTAHGNTLDNLLLNPTLSDLVGGIESVTLSDEEARRRGTQKTVLERRAPPTFAILIEIQDRQRLKVHLDVAAAVDSFLRGRLPLAQIRSRDENGQVHIDLEQPRVEVASGENGRSRRGSRERTRPGRDQSQAAAPSWAWTPETGPAAAAPPAAGGAESPVAPRPAALPTGEPEPEPVRRPIAVYAYGVARNRLEQAAHRLRLPFSITEKLDDADAVVTLKSYYRQRPTLMTDAERHGTPVYVLRSNTMAQIERFLADLFNLELQPLEDDDPLASAIRETEEAVQRIQHGERSVDLAPQSAYIRRRQHQLARQANLISHSYGKEPFRRVRIYRE